IANLRNAPARDSNRSISHLPCTYAYLPAVSIIGRWAQVFDLTGAANRIRTCDPVITNDVLYQLSYCGGPCGASATGLKTPAPDIGQRPILQETRGRAAGESPSPAGQKAAPAAGLALRRIDLFREFIGYGFVIDPGIVGRPDNGNYRRHGCHAALPEILPLPKQRPRRYRCGPRFGR